MGDSWWKKPFVIRLDVSESVATSTDGGSDRDHDPANDDQDSADTDLCGFSEHEDPDADD